MQILFSCRSSFFVIFLILFAVPALASAPTISWDELRPDTAIQFDDPIAQLSQEQLRDLRIIKRIRWLIANKKSAPDGVSAQEEKQLVKHLSDQGIDVDLLLSKREEIASNRRQTVGATNSGVIDTVIRIPGYVMPLDTDQPEVRDFLLVPWVAPCAHVPPPVANQVIHVTLEQSIAHRDRYDPIWIEGILRRNPSEHTLFLVDGISHIESAYSLEGRYVGNYSSQESNLLDQGVLLEKDSKLSWYERIQTRVTILFTKAMTAIRDGDSSGPVLFGLLLAFAYGALHTLGPGHGKAVVISYFVGHGGSLGRGIRMGGLIAVCHVLSAVVVVGLASFTIRQLTGHAPADYRVVRLASYAAIGAIGTYMLWCSIRDAWPKKRTVNLQPLQMHEHHCGCSACSSIPAQNDTPMGWLAVAAGSVPCTGAILVLLFGLSHNLLIPAILMVAMMSLGMAIAMSGIGVLAIVGRDYAERKVVTNDIMRKRFNHVLRIGAAAVVFLVGFGFFVLTLK
nr:DUF3299 domain-containing protein [uncultured Pseudodesulfovibrio sp.]